MSSNQRPQRQSKILANTKILTPNTRKRKSCTFEALQQDTDDTGAKRRSSVLDNVHDVEAIVAERTYRGKKQFCIRWKDYSPSADTWEPKENILDPTIIINWNAAEAKRKAEEKKKPQDHAGKEQAAEKEKVPQKVPEKAAPIILAPVHEGHQCFPSDSTTVNEFSTHGGIRFVNVPKTKSLNVKEMILRCEKCTAQQSLQEEDVEYGFCCVKFSGRDYVMVKLKKNNKELFLTESETFKNACPMKFNSMITFTVRYRKYTETLKEKIMKMQDTFAKTNFYRLCSQGKHPKRDNISVKSYCNERRTLRELFFLSLQLDIAQFMKKTVDYSLLEEYVKEWHANRPILFKPFNAQAVNEFYEKLFCDICASV